MKRVQLDLITRSQLANPSMLRLVVAKLIPISGWFGHTRRNVMCPFHLDSAPSGKFHQDENGVRMWCFSCRKQYTSYDYIDKVLGQNPLDYLLGTGEFEADDIKEALVEAEEGWDQVRFDLAPHEEHLPNVTAFINSIYRGVKYE